LHKQAADCKRLLQEQPGIKYPSSSTFLRRQDFESVQAEWRQKLLLLHSSSEARFQAKNVTINVKNS
jgi:hypothetical protein